MSITAQSIVQRAVGILQDTTSIRWPINELVRWLNDGQREVVMYRPDALNTTTTMTLAAGSRQDLDNANLTPAPSKLIEITRNMAAGSAKESVSLVPRKMLDASTPGWHNLSGTVNIKHYMYDARDPKTFYVFPPATTAAQLEVMYSAYPTDIAAVSESSSTTYSDVTGNIALPDIYGNALLDFVLYRAYTKDSEYAGNATRAQGHYVAFANTLGIEIKSTVSVAPQMKPGMQAVAA